MGSSFGKVRKYNIHSMDSSLKYNIVSEDEIKHESTTAVPTVNKDIFSRSERTSLGRRVERTTSNHKMNTPQEDDGIFGTDMPASIIPEYYNLRVEEKMLLPQNNIRSSTIGIDEGDYITLKEAKVTNPNPPPRPPKYENEPPPLPPRNKTIFIRPDSSPIRLDPAINSNPKPNQKLYSAEDLNRLLKPLNKQNSVKSRSRTHNYNGHYHSVIPERHPEALIRPVGYYPGTPVCDCQRYNSVRSYHNDYYSPPPYNYIGYIPDTGQQIHQNPQRVYYPPPKYYYDEPNPPQYHSARYKSHLNTGHHKYNTISLDRDIQTHNWYGYRTPTFGILKCNHHIEHPKSTEFQDPHNGVNHEKSEKNATHKDEKVHNLWHERNPLHQTEILNQPEYTGEPPSYRSLRTPSCYTIPEEGSWLPQFQYNPALHHLHRRGYHH